MPSPTAPGDLDFIKRLIPSRKKRRGVFFGTLFALFFSGRPVNADIYSFVALETNHPPDLTARRGERDHPAREEPERPSVGTRRRIGSTPARRGEILNPLSYQISVEFRSAGFRPAKSDFVGEIPDGIPPEDTLIAPTKANRNRRGQMQLALGPRLVDFWGFLVPAIIR